MPFVLKHTLRAGAAMVGSFRPEGWHPKFQVTLVGESPAGAELVWTVRKPDGSEWFGHWVDGSGAGDEAEAKLAPYRAVLANDKLAVFEDHPAAGFRYYTTNKKIIEMPDELAAAAFWYFEGSDETRGTGDVDGVQVRVTVEGWRVLGWKFDEDGNTLEEFEEQGQGGSAPKSAFQHK